MKKFVLIFLIVVLFLVACDFPGAITPTPGGEVTETPGADVTQSPPVSFTPNLGTNTPETPEAALTATPVTYEERVKNGDFEEGYEDCSGGICPVEWTNLFAPPDYPIPLECIGGQTESCNPPGYTMRTPEFGDAPDWVDPFRIFSGKHAFKMHCANQHCRGGIMQKIDTTPGEVCIVEAWAQTWSAKDGRSCTNSEFRSDYCTYDDQIQMHWEIVTNPLGDGIVLINTPLTYKFRIFNYGDGIYDEPSGGAIISLTFEAQADYADVAFIGWQTWPNPINDWYLDYVSVRCSGHVAGREFASPSARVSDAQ